MLARPNPYGWQYLFLRVLIVAIVAVLGVRLYRIQIVDGAKYRVLADRNRLRQVSVPAPRGVMYARNGEMLARNEPSFTVALVPADLPKLASGEPDYKGERVVLDRLLGLLAKPVPALPTLAPTASPTPTAGPTAAASPTPTTRPSPTPRPTPTVGPGTPPPAASLANMAGIVERQPWIMDRAEIERQIEAGLLGGAYRPITVAKYIDQATAFLIAEDAANLPGVDLTLMPVRDYLAGTLMSHIVGYMAGIPESELPDYEARGYQQTDQVGLVGLEKTFEDELRGKPGEQTIEVDVNGRRVRTVGQGNPAQPGHNLVLTIDLKLQETVTKILQEGLNKTTGFAKSTQGAIVVLNPRNGAVLALVSLPSYDDNWFAKGITPEAWDALNKDPDLPMIDKATGGVYPPGSTFKPIPSAGGLQEGVITPQTRFTDNGGILLLPNKYGGPAQPFYCWSHAYGYGHGPITVREALAESCDVFFYQLGGGFPNVTPGLGVSTLGYYAREFGLGALTGIDLEGEAAGLVPDEKYKRLNYAEQWFTGDTYNMSIGQGFVLATPLQIANMTAAVANRGTLYRPQLVDHVADAEGRLLRDFQPQVIRQVAVDPANLDVVREGMFGAVNWDIGTAPVVRLPGVQVAGKTGTAEYAKLDAKGNLIKDAKGNMPTHAWFTSFAPYADPEVVVTVFVNNGGEGSGVAAPLAAKVLRAYFNIPEPAEPAGPARPGD